MENNLKEKSSMVNNNRDKNNTEVSSKIQSKMDTKRQERNLENIDLYGLMTFLIFLRKL